MKPSTPDDYTTTIPADRRPENRCMAVVDREGYVVRLVPVAEGSEMEFLRFIERQRIPIDPADIVLGAGDRLDADGRLLSVLEVEQAKHEQSARAA